MYEALKPNESMYILSVAITIHRVMYMFITSHTKRKEFLVLWFGMVFIKEELINQLRLMANIKYTYTHTYIISLTRLT